MRLRRINERLHKNSIPKAAAAKEQPVQQHQRQGARDNLHQKRGDKANCLQSVSEEGGNTGRYTVAQETEDAQHSQPLAKNKQRNILSIGLPSRLRNAGSPAFGNKRPGQPAHT